MNIHTPDLIGRIYAEAAAVTGKPVLELQAMAEQVFASMLYHALIRRERQIWTEASISNGRLLVEVDSRPRLRPHHQEARS